MADPRKPVVTPPNEHGAEILAAVHTHLCSATELGAQAIGTTGASFVIMGMGVWAKELAELDGRAAAKYLRGLADLFDPKSNEAQKRRAEKDRHQAVRALFEALDLEMAEAEGHG